MNEINAYYSVSFEKDIFRKNSYIQYWPESTFNRLWRAGSILSKYVVRVYYRNNLNWTYLLNSRTLYNIYKLKNEAVFFMLHLL